MKKIALLLALLLLGLSVCSCGGKTVEKACEEADKMLVEWTNEGFAGCSYSGEQKDVQGVPCYVVNARLSSAANSSEYFDYVVVYAAKDIKETVYSKLTDHFSEFDITVMITIADSQGNAYAGIIDGEVTYFD